MGEAVPVGEADVPAVAAAAARAFAEDGMFTFVFPDRSARPAKLDRFFRGAVRYGRLAGTVVTTPQRAGVAIWLPPGHTTMSVAAMARAGMLTFPVTLGPAAFRRFTAYTSWLDGQRRELAPDPHWFLLALGVDPVWQRRGVGRTLTAPTLADADERGLPAYLETTSEANVAYYERSGFGVAREAVPDAGPRTWSMRREPRR
ncbi:GNAT family N-acetyltransferase [Actinomycetospora straminea]|uniref:GNAT family N-acetyltransferase n=1 Tax=Actinomycetospora straminea TaxID=663607 RepID=A0ABP9ESP3_9PSEU|nr:GNAT family N-acetyltransferase [Actinomycetospora straminea]MDD7933942.1 GNAT family N-acetyltransferase [Actinomycetospora straminea]